MMRPFSLYIHWPFCLSKCPYCDFNSHVAQSIETNQWLEAYKINLNRWAQLTQGRSISTIYFGGGTPSLMPPSMVREILEHISSLWPKTSDCEITLEANPNSAEVQRFEAFAMAGIERLSLGVQSLRQDALQFLGRKHSVAEAKKAIENARQCFARYTFDLIYARPQQTQAQWQDELEEALALANGHLSLYQLTIEPNTAFAITYNRGDFVLPDEDLAAKFYQDTNELMENWGYNAYEVSNYSRKGQESRHNLNYWNYGDYIGIGPGAHGRVTIGERKYATVAERAPQTWLKSVLSGQEGLKEKALISSRDQLKEILVMGLRVGSGLPWSRLEKFVDVQQAIDCLRKDYLFLDGYIDLDQQKITASKQGILVLNTVIARIDSLIGSNIVSG